MRKWKMTPGEKSWLQTDHQNGKAASNYILFAGISFIFENVNFITINL